MKWLPFSSPQTTRGSTLSPFVICRPQCRDVFHSRRNAPFYNNKRFNAYLVMKKTEINTVKEKNRTVIGTDRWRSACGVEHGLVLLCHGFQYKTTPMSICRADEMTQTSRFRNDGLYFLCLVQRFLHFTQ